jgi:hypothetical protein
MHSLSLSRALQRALCARWKPDPWRTPIDRSAVLVAPSLNDRSLSSPRDETAIHELIDLHELTQPYERQLRWRIGDEAWDPREILRSITGRGSRTP